MGVYTHSEGNWLSRRGTFLIILIAFHVALFWALKSGFAVKFVKSITEPIKAEIIQTKPEEPPPPPPPEVQIDIPPVQVPPILVDIPNPPPPPPTVIVAPKTTEPVPPAPPAPPAPPRPSVVTRPQFGNIPNPNDYYPSASRSLGEEGVAKIRLCYDAEGNLEDPALSESSGSDRLDGAAIRLAKRIRVKKPGTVDGKPQAGCAVLPVRFSMKGY